MSTRSLRTSIAVLGALAVTAYAVVMVLQISVWNPLAAAPGLTLGEIGAVAASRGETVFTPAPWVFACIGIGLALVVLVPAILVPTASTRVVTAAYLAIIAGGAPAYFAASFGPGMSLADTFAISGGDHAAGGSVLMVASGTAAIVLVVLGVAYATSGRATASAVSA
ncbi:hypothetical protein ACIGEP_01290 [Microbacterium sp. NPDC077663]|uniref:hypothetical protein n=1 Tax=Microbacterium sp. NPDC077663 TaxID=3364189 RepID=UPI0037CB53E0